MITDLSSAAGFCDLEQTALSVSLLSVAGGGTFCLFCGRIAVRIG